MKFLYHVKNDKRDCEVIVSGRPKTLQTHFDMDNDGVPKGDEDCDAYLSVTDTFAVAPKGKIFVWFPWNEGRKPIPEMFYACNQVLNWWTYYQKLKRIMIFCDGGTHRSVTVFGAFLMTYFTKEERETIVKGRTPLYKHDDKKPEEIPDHWGGPLNYIDGYLEEFPADRLLFKAMNKDWLGRLDGHSTGIYNLVKERYGDNK